MRYPLHGKPSDVQLLPKYPRAMAVSPQNVNPPPIGSTPTVASEPSATLSDLIAFYTGNAQYPCNGNILSLPPLLHGLYSLDDAVAAETIRSFKSVNNTSRPLVLPPAGPDATSPASLCPPRVLENRGAIGSSLGGAGGVTAVRQRSIHCDSFSDTGSARKSHPWSVGRDFEEDLVAPMALFDIDNPMIPLRSSTHRTRPRRGAITRSTVGQDAPFALDETVPEHLFARAQEASWPGTLPVQRCPKRPHPRPIPLPPDLPPSHASRHLHDCHQPNSSPMDVHAPLQGRTDPPPEVVFAPRPREHALMYFLLRMNIEEEDNNANPLFAVDAFIDSDAGEDITPDATARMACPQDLMNSHERTQAEHAASEWTQDDPMVAPRTFDSTTGYANPNNIARGHRITLTRSFDATLAQQSEYPPGGYAHVHDGRSHHSQHSQTAYAAGVPLPSPPRREAHISPEMESFTPQPYLGNVDADTVSDGCTVAAAKFSVRSQVFLTPSLDPPSSVRLSGDPEEFGRDHCGQPQVPSLHGAAALDPIDKISSRGAGAQCAAQYNLIEPGRAPAQGPPAQSAASIGLGLQLYLEDIDHAMTL